MESKRIIKMLNLQKYLVSGNTPQQLKEELGINCKVDSEYPNLHLFKYDQIESPKNHPVVLECRGTILDKINNWGIVSFPYNRFFNAGEGHAAVIDWSSAVVYEKLDGSCLQLYFYNGVWRVGTLGMPNANGEVSGAGNFTFNELFWNTFNSLSYKLPTEEYNKYTFMFELMTPYNRVVVRHLQNKLVLHGIRNNNTLQEYSPDSFNMGWEVVKSYKLGTISEIMEAATHLDPMASEGFVVVDKDFNRQKVKSPAYVALHHAVDGVSSKSLLELIRSNENSEFLSYFPEYEVEYNDLAAKYEKFVKTVAAIYEKYKSIENQKDFALKVKDLPYSGLLFALRNGKINSVRSACVEMPVDKLLMLVEKI
jgi:hypothetical protein